ncbi:MAG TPA: hypothetical protein VFK16_12115 [Gemmatimonadaceae bacterium]|jgi:hypothetical protein|nr:hypothetical protein [Gemmatimonadaceae bacterium]
MRCAREHLAARALTSAMPPRVAARATGELARVVRIASTSHIPFQWGAASGGHGGPPFTQSGVATMAMAPNR